MFDGAIESAANARTELRALPVRSTIRDSVASLAAFAGLLEGLYRADHPLKDRPGGAPRELLRAVEDGPDAELRWATADGTETADADALSEELYEIARDGLVARGLSRRTARECLRSLHGRYRHGNWNRHRVRAAVEA